MYIFELFLVISHLFENSFADLRNCSKSHTKPAICFKNKTGYSKPFPTVLDVELFVKDIIEIDEQRNSISIHMALWTFWSDPSLALSNGETEG